MTPLARWRRGIFGVACSFAGWALVGTAHAVGHWTEAPWWVAAAYLFVAVPPLVGGAVLLFLAWEGRGHGR